MEFNLEENTTRYSGTHSTMNSTSINEKYISHEIYDPDNKPANSFRHRSKLLARAVTEHLVVKIIVIILILIDISILISSLVTPANRQYDWVTFGFSCIFVIEVLVRIYGLGLRTFFRNWVNGIDFAVVVVTFLSSVVSVSLVSSTISEVTSFIRILRFIRLPRLLNILRLILSKDSLINSSRYMTSENKRRYRLDGYDLDLCYITNRVIAMSFPSSGITALYRNAIGDVAQFLNERYGSNYRIYNLCEERGYKTHLFNGEVVRFMITDHNVPRLKDMVDFAKSSRDWMSSNDDNCVVVHCRGGKGRTGTMICTHLLDCGVFKSSEEVLNYFGGRRTDISKGNKFQGVDTPSQSRYVGYFAAVKNTLQCKEPPSRRLKINCIKINNIRDGRPQKSSTYHSLFDTLTCSILQSEDTNIKQTSRVIEIVTFNLTNQEICTTTKDGNNSDTKDPAIQSVIIKLINPPIICGDVKIKFSSINNSLKHGYDNCAFFFWFHTYFINDYKLLLARHEIDNPHKKGVWSTYGADFGIEIYFSNID